MQTLAENADDDQTLLGDLARFFLFNKLSDNGAATGDSRLLANSLTPSARLETFLQICEERRNRHLAKKKNRGDMMPQDLIFDAKDMTEIHNDWLEDFETWMHPDKQHK